MQIIDIYEKYHLPEGLQLHMLRVAACAKLIIDNWNGVPIDEKMILRVLLLHDMGNIVKIKDSCDSEFNELRNKYIKTFDLDDHRISLEIAKELDLSNEEILLMQEKESQRNEEIMKKGSWEAKICAYCDQRVAPIGVLLLKERLEDAKARYKNTTSIWGDCKKADYLISCAIEIEKQIMKHCIIKSEAINNQAINKIIGELKKYDI